MSALKRIEARRTCVAPPSFAWIEPTSHRWRYEPEMAAKPIVVLEASSTDASSVTEPVEGDDQLAAVADVAVKTCPAEGVPETATEPRPLRELEGTPANYTATATSAAAETVEPADADPTVSVTT